MRLLFILTFLIAYLTINSSVHAQSICNPEIVLPSRTNENTYQIRGNPNEGTDRCEGIYEKQVNSGRLQLYSFTSVFELFEPENNNLLYIKWPPVDADSISMRATSMRSDFDYLMDAKKPIAPQIFTWELDIMKNVAIRWNEIAISSWVDYDFSETINTMLVPLQVSLEQSNTSSSSYEILLFTEEEISEVYYTLATVDDNNQVGEILEESIALGYGYYPTFEAIPFNIDKQKLDEGIYFLHIGATLEAGGSIFTEKIFYHTTSL